MDGDIDERVAEIRREMAAFQRLGSIDDVGSQSDRALNRDDVQADPPWAAHPVTVKIDGVVEELYPIGDLAHALGRSPATIRDWERRGVLPPCRYRRKHPDPRCQRRLYEKLYIIGLVQLARRERMLGHRPRSFAENNFSAGAWDLYRRLHRGGQNGDSA